MIQIILLNGFDVCISIVRLNRYVIKRLTQDKIAHLLIQIILLHGFDIGISIVRLNRYVIQKPTMMKYYDCYLTYTVIHCSQSTAAIGRVKVELREVGPCGCSSVPFC